jgi:hypothetical protein
MDVIRTVDQRLACLFSSKSIQHQFPARKNLRRIDVLVVVGVHGEVSESVLNARQLPRGGRDCKLKNRGGGVVAVEPGRQCACDRSKGGRSEAG